MSGSCLLVGATVLQLAAGDFQLSWLHSVEKSGWRESWRIAGDNLLLVEAAVRGSGAGMDPGDGALLSDGWWVWRPDLPSVPSLTLAASGATEGGWTICADGDCREIGDQPGAPILVRVCPR